MKTHCSQKTQRNQIQYSKWRVHTKKRKTPGKNKQHLNEKHQNKYQTKIYVKKHSGKKQKTKMFKLLWLIWKSKQNKQHKKQRFSNYFGWFGKAKQINKKTKILKLLWLTWKSKEYKNDSQTILAEAQLQPK